MGIYIFNFVIVVLGVYLSMLIGKANQQKQGFGAVALFGLISIILGGFLVYSGLQAALLLCKVTSMLCIKTTDETVWFVIVPAFLFPLYWVVMLVFKR